MRVALVSPYSWTVPGGVNHHIEHLAEELEERGHEPWIIAPVGAFALTRRAVDSRRHKAAERFIPMGTAISIPTNGSRAYLSPNPKIAMRMDRAIRNGRFDVMHVHEPATPSVALSAVLLATSPVVGTFHAAIEDSPAYDRWMWLMRLVDKRLDVRIAVSPAALAFPAGRFPGEYRIIPNGVTVEQYASAIGAPKVPGRILFIGRAEKRKGLGVMLKAFALLRRRLPEATLVIAGATRRDIYESTREPFGAGAGPDLHGVEPLGWVTDEAKVRLLGEAEVVCAPSLAAESFGIVLAEAMAAGVPVVASDLPGYRAVLGDGEAGRLVPPNEPPLLANALFEMLGDADERRRLSAAGLVVAERLSWRRVTDQILEAYEDALAAPFRPGIHGRPGRPWFGQALVAYARDLALRRAE
ncbi:MAG TPA: glycosyltransferase family 4 protein [Thermoleophilia bacterium]|nr:glycosyltransferase family 4 protein [Thermoleophilia bacterium]